MENIFNYFNKGTPVSGKWQLASGLKAGSCQISIGIATYSHTAETYLHTQQVTTQTDKQIAQEKCRGNLERSHVWAIAL